MRLGRPDIATYRSRFDVPAADGDFAVTFAGVSTLLFDDGKTAVLTDGFLSRPSLLRVGVARIAPDEARVDAALARLGLDERLAAVVPVHAHFDHAMDSAFVVERVGGLLVGGVSVANLGRGHGLPAERIDVVASGESRTYGAFTLTWLESTHCPPDRFPGTIVEPVVPPVRAAAYRCGEAWSILVDHPRRGSALVHGSAGHVAGALSGRRAEVVYLGVGQLGVQDPDYIRTYWAETVETVGARRVVLTHWDDFFRGLDRPLRALPYLGDDLDATMSVLTELADKQRVALHLPTVWRREDPWVGIG